MTQVKVKQVSKKIRAIQSQRIFKFVRNIGGFSGVSYANKFLAWQPMVMML